MRRTRVDWTQVKMLLSRLHAAGITRMGDEQATNALACCPDDIDQAYNLLVLANESIEGELKDYNQSVPMLGAVNRNMVTCYLDALLFAMFARLDSFEAMLYDNFDDEPRKKLAAILRLWVNLLRTGRLIRVELVRSSTLFLKFWLICTLDKASSRLPSCVWLGRSGTDLPARRI